MSERIGALALTVLIAACTVDSLDLAGRECPCVPGWICDEARNVCLRPEVGDGDADSDADADADSDADADADSDADSDADADSDSDADSDADADTDSDADSDSDADGDGDINPCDVAQDLALGDDARGNTTGSPSGLDGICDESVDQPNDVWNILLPGAGVLRIVLTLPDEDGDGAPDWAGLLRLQTDCGQDDREVCGAGGYYALQLQSQVTQQITFCSSEGQTVHAIVDGRYTRAGGLVEGPYLISTEWSDACPVDCLNGYGCAQPLDGGEECADAVPLPLDTQVYSDTTGHADDVQGSCYGGNAEDEVFSLDVPAAGVLDVAFDPMDGNFGGELSLRTDCADAATEYACWHHVVEPVCVEAGTTFLVVDGFLTDHVVDEGPFVLGAHFEECDAGCLDGACL